MNSVLKRYKIDVHANKKKKIYKSAEDSKRYLREIEFSIAGTEYSRTQATFFSKELTVSEWSSVFGAKFFIDYDRLVQALVSKIQT